MEKEKIDDKPSKIEKSLEGVGSFEEKLKLLIDFMKRALSQEGCPDFREFWEAKRLALLLFKEEIDPVVRSKHWKEYIDLSSEAKRLKGILNEQSAFAYEQLKKAIAALKGDIDKSEILLKEIDGISFPKSARSILKKEKEYNKLQLPLNLLNVFASRINSLRREVIKTDMRVRKKSEFFKELSSLGDSVFPKRKELIKEISDKFSLDVKRFISLNFSDNKEKVPFHLLKEEIKALQNLAKILTLNTKSFTEVRLKLSKCWDSIKTVGMSDKAKIYKEAFDKVDAKIVELKGEMDRLSPEEVIVKSDDIFKFMKEVELGRFDIKRLKTALKELIEPVKRKIEKIREKKREEEAKKRKDSIEQLERTVRELVESEDSYDVEAIVAKRDETIKKRDELALSKRERAVIDRWLKALKDVISNKKESALLSLSGDQLEALDQMKKVLADREKRRLETKAQLEKYREAVHSSGLDFEEGIALRKTIDLEKKRLADINIKIAEIKEKIDSFGE